MEKVSNDCEPDTAVIVLEIQLRCLDPLSQYQSFEIDKFRSFQEVPPRSGTTAITDNRKIKKAQKSMVIGVVSTPAPFIYESVIEQRVAGALKPISVRVTFPETHLRLGDDDDIAGTDPFLYN